MKVIARDHELRWDAFLSFILDKAFHDFIWLDDVNRNLISNVVMQRLKSPNRSNATLVSEREPCLSNNLRGDLLISDLTIINIFFEVFQDSLIYCCSGLLISLIFE